jgi:hypothetical protein
MKKITFTVAQLLFLTEVYHVIGFGSRAIRDIIDANQNPSVDVETELPDEDIEDIADSIQSHIDGGELSDEDLAIANSILVLLGILEEEVVEESADQHDVTDEDDEYSPNPD